VCMTGGPHGGEHDDVVLGCDDVWTHREISTFRGNVLSPSSELKIST
jgi:hypothetical protein